MNTKKFKREKSGFKNESAALQSVCNIENVKPEQLTAEHTEKHFVWLLNETETKNPDFLSDEEVLAKYPLGVFAVPKSDNTEYQDAVNAAVEHWNTFEANIKRVEEEEDEEHYVFTKVRG